MAQALTKAGFWWNATEVERVVSDDQALNQSLTWMREHKLGRNRLLDTLLAATCYRSGVSRVMTSNAHDYRIFGVFGLTET